MSNFNSEEIVGTCRTGDKKFKKQRIEKATEEEKIRISDLIPLRNDGRTEVETVWFDPVIDPKKHVLKQPTKQFEGGVSFLLYAGLPNNSSVKLMPFKFAVVGSGFCVHSGLYENKSAFGDFPSWYASIVGLSSHLSIGVFVPTSHIEPHNLQELKVSLFNMGNATITIKPTDPIGEIVFNGCHVPNVASTSGLVERFQGKNKIFVIEFFVKKGWSYKLKICFFRYSKKAI
jgi:hypothetical protein